MGYCTSYDWSTGSQGHNQAKQRPQIYLHTLKRPEVDPKAAATTNTNTNNNSNNNNNRR